MKFKLIALAYIFIIGSASFADDIFLSGGLTAEGSAGITGFNSRTVKIQPEIRGNAFFYVNFGETFKTGLSGGFIYAFASDIDGGWSYPGFSGLETGIDFRMTMPFWEALDLGLNAGAGWYRYNLTESHFFLPSVGLYPAFRLLNNDHTALFVEIPVKYYFHRAADIFMSTGIQFRAVWK